MEDIIVNFTEDQFLHTSAPYEYLAGIASATERDRETAVYRKFAQKACGITAATFKAELKKAEIKLAGEQTAVTTSMTEFPGQPIALKCPGYVCNDTGVWLANGSMYGPVCVCLHPIMPVRQIVNYDTGEHKTEIAFKRGPVWHSLIVPSAVLGSATRIVQPLRERGVIVDSESARGLVTYFSRMESANIDRLVETHSATRMGWIGKQFLPYEDQLIFDGSADFGQMYDSIHEHGDKQKWFDLIARVRRGGNVVTRAMLAASFASVVNRPLRQLPFIVHSWTESSGAGKTVALMMVASVWADPNEGAYVKNMNTTDVGVEATAGFLGSLPLCLDELCLKDQKSNSDKLESFVYQFCEGSGRTRGTRTGGVQRQKQWNCCAVTTGETPITSYNTRAGAINRVLDLASGDKPLFDDPRSTAKILRENYGFAGKMFVQALLEDGAVEQIEQYRDQYRQELLLCGDVTDKQADVASIVLAADRFAAVKVFDDVYNLRAEEIAPLLTKKADVDINLRAYGWLMDTLVANNYCFEPTDEHYHGAVWGRLEEVGEYKEFQIIRARFAELMRSAGYNDRAFLSWAKRKGILSQNAAQRDMTKPVRLSSYSGLVRCVCIRAGALDSGLDTIAKNEESAPEGKLEQVEVEQPW